MRIGLFAAALALIGVSAARAQTTVTAPAQGTVVAPPPGTVKVFSEATPAQTNSATLSQGTVIAPPGVTVITLPDAATTAPPEASAPAQLPVAAAVPVQEAVPSAESVSNLSISSPAFFDGGTIPSKYTKEGGNISLPLEIKGLPPKAVSYAILMDDPDAESRVSLHWLVNLPASVSSIPEGKLPKEAMIGANSWDHTRYDGPERTTGIHRYFIRVYALDVVPTLPKGFTREDFITLISGHLLGTAQIMGSSNGAK
ncbi:hypothetical protein BH09VER1_BH09VER1_41100 [soil metagenome]